MSPNNKNTETQKKFGALVDPAGDARTRLIQAGLEAFGLYNFEGASTRELARLAGVNLSAIPYHFGGKEGLYKAVVEHITANLLEKTENSKENARALLEKSGAAATELLAALQDFLENIAAAMLLTPEARYWARIMLREQMAPTSAYDTLYDKALCPAHALLTGLVARVSRKPPDDPEARVRAFTLMGQVLIFRATQETIKRRMGWAGVDPGAFEIIRDVIRENVAAIVRGFTTTENGVHR